MHALCIVSDVELFKKYYFYEPNNLHHDQNKHIFITYTNNHTPPSKRVYSIEIKLFQEFSYTLHQC